jgi:hypothetical protein
MPWIGCCVVSDMELLNAAVKGAATGREVTELTARFILSHPGEWFLYRTEPVAKRHDLGYRIRHGRNATFEAARAGREGHWDATVRTVYDADGERTVKAYLRWVEA